ncbi:MAG: SDR family oxidoreductase [Chlamydiia bacterium]|nr:SDR family oxidoreductase [Chlamydiia bacterium]
MIRKLGIYQEDPENSYSERVTIAERQGASENKNCEDKSTQIKTNLQIMMCIEVNLRSYFLMGRHVAKRMIAEGAGKIINMSSNATFYGTPGSGPYAVSKAGIIQLTKTMAIEWGSSNIQVNAVCPTVVMTKLVVCRKNPSPLLTHLLTPFAPQKPPLVILTMLSVFGKQIALKIWITFDEGFLRQTTRETGVG